MILSTRGILDAIDNGKLEITPMDISHLGPCSYDLTIGDKIGFYPLLTDNGQMVYYGQVTADIDPDRFGPTAAMNPEDVGVTHIVQRPMIDLAEYQDMIITDIPETGYVLYPGNVYLCQVNEELNCLGVVPEVSGRSKIARAGLEVHLTAGFGNLGDKFKYILELKPTYPTKIYPNMRLAQVRFHTVEESYKPGTITYRGTYSADKRAGYAADIIGYIPDSDLRETVRVTKERVRREMEAEYARQEQLRKEAEEAAAAQAVEEEKQAVPVSEDMKLDMGELGVFDVVVDETPASTESVEPAETTGEPAVSDDGVVITPIVHKPEE